MNKIYGSILILLVISITNCLFGKIPDWATTNKHKKYPASRYFLGVGIADEKTPAIERARADVAKQIRVKIESELATMEKEFRQDDKRTITSEVESRTKSIVSETISGIEVAEVKSSKGKFYVLAVLNKSKYLTGIEVEMDEILQKTEQFVEGARESYAAGKIFTAIENYNDAQKIIPEFYTKGGLYTALSGKKYPNINRFSGSGILSEMRKVLAGVELQIISGNNQEGSAGSLLPMPIVIKVINKSEDGAEIGIDKFPVTAKYQNGERIKKRETGSDGAIKYRISAIPTDNVGRNGTVIFSLDLQKLPQNIKGSLSRSAKNLHYSIKIADLKFSIKISNMDNDDCPEVKEMLTQLITDNGYSVIENAPFLIEGQINVAKEKTIDSPIGKQYYVETEAKLNLTDMSSGDVIAFIRAKGKGLDVNSHSAALEKANSNIKVSRKKFTAFLQSAVIN